MASKPVKSGIKPITKSMMGGINFKREHSANSITSIKIQEAEDSMFEIGNKSNKMMLILEDGMRAPEDALTVATKPKNKLCEEKVPTKKSRAGTTARGHKLGKTKQLDRDMSLSLDLGSLWDAASRNGKSRNLILENGVRVPEDALTVATKPKKKLFEEKVPTKKSRAGTVARGCKMRETKQQDRGTSLSLDIGSMWDAASRNNKSSKVVLEDGVRAPEDALTVATKPKNKLFEEKVLTKKSRARTVARGCKMGETKQLDRDRSLSLDLGSLWDAASRNGKSNKMLLLLEDGVCALEGKSKPRTKVSGNTPKSLLLKKGSDAVAKSTNAKASVKSNTRSKSNQKSLRAWDNSSDQDAFFERKELFTLAEQLVSKGSEWFNSLGSKSYETSQIDTRGDDAEVSEEWKIIGGTRFNWNSANDEDDDPTREQEDEEAITEEQINHWFNWTTAAGSSDDDAKTYATGWDDDAKTYETGWDDDTKTCETGWDSDSKTYETVMGDDSTSKTIDEAILSVKADIAREYKLRDETVV